MELTLFKTLGKRGSVGLPPVVTKVRNPIDVGVVVFSMVDQALGGEMCGVMSDLGRTLASLELSYFQAHIWQKYGLMLVHRDDLTKVQRAKVDMFIHSWTAQAKRKAKGEGFVTETSESDNGSRIYVLRVLCDEDDEFAHRMKWMAYACIDRFDVLWSEFHKFFDPYRQSLIEQFERGQNGNGLHV